VASRDNFVSTLFEKASRGSLAAQTERCLISREQLLEGFPDLRHMLAKSQSDTLSTR